MVHLNEWDNCLCSIHKTFHPWFLAWILQKEVKTMCHTTLKNIRLGNGPSRCLMHFICWKHCLCKFGQHCPHPHFECILPRHCICIVHPSDPLLCWWGATHLVDLTYILTNRFWNFSIVMSKLNDTVTKREGDHLERERYNSAEMINHEEYTDPW